MNMLSEVSHKVKISPLFILGSSGHAREIAEYVHTLYPNRDIYFVDQTKNEPDVISIELYTEMLHKIGGESVLGSGRCEIRERMLIEIREPFATLIHPHSTVLGKINPGCVISPGAVIAPNAYLQEHVLVNYNAAVGHDTCIGSLSVIGPGAAIGGWVQIGESVYIGAGSLIREKLTIGARAIIGMGAVVTKDVPEGMVALGIPAKFIKREECGGGWL
jgi:sugar O-acyltransferase (sialic acid O-acetyltransferase NeuD family)